MASEDLISFDIIEDHKENIQSLPSGRSAKALASTLTPLSARPTPPISASQSPNDTTRAAYESELLSLNDSDDPLDIYDRYIKWTLDAYPAAQDTPQSQLLPLLERATKAFLGQQHYKNDPRYLKIWLLYIRLFPEEPRETFAFLARNGIGEGLALYYEDFAAWLEGAGRWQQAAEVFHLGMQRGARPGERLVRKFGEFERRREAKESEEGPGSPALPVTRRALEEKVDPFVRGLVQEEENNDPQARDRREPMVVMGKKSVRPKIEVFKDEGEPERSELREGPGGWESIEGLKERKKENIMEAKPWVGETMKGGKRNFGVSKMMIYKDESEHPYNSFVLPTPLPKSQCFPNAKTGRIDFVAVDLDAIYPNGYDEQGSHEEYCFEELRAMRRGLLDCSWEEETVSTALAATPNPQELHQKEVPLYDSEDMPASAKPIEALEKKFQRTMALNDVDENGNLLENNRDLQRRMRKEEKANRTRKIKVMDVKEVKAETQTVQLNLASPTGPRIKRKKSAEPTMTINTKEAMEEVYGIFNAPLQMEQVQEESEESDDDDDYTSAGESTGTGRISGATSEFGDETRNEFGEETKKDLIESQRRQPREGTDTDVKSEAEWSDFTASKHVPKLQTEDDVTDSVTRTSSDAFEVYEDQEAPSAASREQDAVQTPIESEFGAENIPPDTEFVPLPPDDFEAPTHPWRNPEQIAQSRLPFMTPIVEKTESSLGMATAKTDKDYFNAKTPSRQTNVKTPTIPEIDDAELMSSPFQEVLNETSPPRGKLDPILTGSRPKKLQKASPAKKSMIFRAPSVTKEERPKGPIIKDLQCNPVDQHIRETILEQVHPPLSTFEGFHDHRNEHSNRLPEVTKFVKAVSKARKSSGADKTMSSISNPPDLRFPDISRTYTLKRELGQGAYAPVFLVESNSSATEMLSEDGDDAPVKMGEGAFTTAPRLPLEAVKSESPPTAWEFYILRTAHRRLGVHRAAESIIHAHEMHLYRDECFLVESYRDQGTLLDLVNVARDLAAKGGSVGAGGPGVDECLAMFLSVELLRTVEALHKQGIIHGDLKPDNVLVRFEDAAAVPTASFSSSRGSDGWDAQYQPAGSGGWSAKGVSLIDFGRGIDMRAFQSGVQFIADWKMQETDCAEMRELRPWTYQCDYHGLAGCIYSLLFGKYIETVVEKNTSNGIVGAGLGQGTNKRYKVKEGFKRYWQTEIWADCFDLLLNSSAKADAEEGMKLPILKGIKGVREKMETWLEDNCERGVGLKAMIRKMEAMMRERRKM
ncbi:MAG: hypothetical protein M1820_003999 [Bogoriella megaspora]|nr:MAG: hypothetical protein M1820_003999 [Bogoriella megaspora]